MSDMPKSRRLSLRLDEELDRAISAECESLSCSKSEYVEGLLRANMEETPTTKSVVAANQEKEIVQGHVRPLTYVIDATAKPSKVKGVEIDGKFYEYCESCKRYSRMENGKQVYWSREN